MMAKFGEWTRVEDEMPEVEAWLSGSGPVLATDGRITDILCWTCEPDRKTGEVMEPRWMNHSRVAHLLPARSAFKTGIDHPRFFYPTHWMPMPPLPTEPAPDA